MRGAWGARTWPVRLAAAPEWAYEFGVKKADFNRANFSIGRPPWRKFGDSTTLERKPDSGVQLKSASALAFAPGAVLLIGDGIGGRVYAYETGDVAPHAESLIQIEDLTGKIGALLGTTPDQIRVLDLVRSIRTLRHASISGAVAARRRARTPTT